MKRMLLLAVSAMLMSCGGAKEVATTADRPDCTSALEGVFHSRVTYNGRVPVLVLKEAKRDQRVLHGTALSVTDAGILFDEDRDGPFHDPDPELYPLEKVACVVDSAQNILYGELPKDFRATWDMDILLRQEWEKDGDLLKLRLTAGEPFSFCLPPGEYTATAFIFRQREAVAVGVLVPTLAFTVEPKTVSYLGEFRLELDSADAPGVCIVPFKLLETKGGYFPIVTQGGMVGAIIAGLAAGVVAGLSANTADGEITGGFRLKLQQDAAYKSSLQLPLRTPQVTLAPNPLMPPATR